MRCSMWWRLVTSGAVLVMGLSLGLAGCSMKAAPAQSTGFVPQERMEHDPALPFHKVWRQPGLNWEKYKKIYVAPVNTAYMLQATEWQQGERRGEIEQDVQQLAFYTQDAIKKAFRDDAKRRLQVIESATQSPDTFILEVALTEVIPSKVLLNALGYAPFWIGTSINVARGLAEDKSSVAIEGRGRDAVTREMVFTLADREVEQKALASVRGLTWYSHAHQIIDTWAEQFVRVANRDRAAGEVIEDTKPFTLKPW